MGCSTEEKSITIQCDEPVVLKELFVYRDGGTLGFILDCADGNELRFCIDGKINSPTAGYFFVDVTHATQEGGVMLSKGGVEEGKLLSLLDSWLEANFTDEQTSRIAQSIDFNNMTKKEFRAWHIKRLIDGRKKLGEI
jgi:hypothetical protein